MPDSSIEKKRADRLRFMNALYDLSGANTSNIVATAEILASAGIDLRDEAVEALAQYLAGQGLIIPYWSLESREPDEVAITHGGIVEVEEARSAPELPTEHFPPAINIIHVGGDIV